MDELDSDDGEVEKTRCSSTVEVCVIWSGPAKERLPVMLFSADMVPNLGGPLTQAYLSPHNVTYKLGPDCYKVVRTIFHAHGLIEVPLSSTSFNIFWTNGSGIKPHTLRHFKPHQKTNHFPRFSEITRKDKLCENVRRMQLTKGIKHFNIIPKTFILPEELDRFLSTYRRQRGVWIVKPTTLSRGRGIYLIDHPNQLPSDETLVISEYIKNPLCIDGFKFDLRLYVAVTSFNPLRVYLYKEGLTRFATVRYAGNEVQLDNRYMHLTNYSLNKKSADFVRCEDPSVEDFGNKWSFSALLRYLREEGVDIAVLMAKIEDVIIKTLICAETPITASMRAFQTHRSSCFELYGFDVLVDENLQPWVLEVNLSPSLACDAPLDLKIKSNLVADLLSLVGITMQDPSTGKAMKHEPHQHVPNKAKGSCGEPLKSSSSSSGVTRGGVSGEELALLRETKEEYARRKNFVRIFPSEDSWELYGAFLDTKNTMNFRLHKQLYPDSVKNSRPAPVQLHTIIANRLQGLSEGVVLDTSPHNMPTGLNLLQKATVYARILEQNRRPCPPGVAKYEVVAPSSENKKEGVSKNTFFESSVTTVVKKTEQPVEPGKTPEADHTTTGQFEHVIQSCANLSKLQVRQVFASYLEQVQKRLLKETWFGVSSVQKSASSEKETNMEVVLRFLSKAAHNLKAPFSVVEPDQSLSLRERKKLLAQQLEEFVLLYRKETVEEASQDTGILHGSTSVPSQTFKSFLSEASEGDLERLLSLYTKYARSSSAFLSLSSSCNKDSNSRDDTINTQNETTSTVISSNTAQGNPQEADVSCNQHGKLHEKHRPSSRRFCWVGESQGSSPEPSTSPKYTKDMLQSSDLPASCQTSLDSLTKSLADWNVNSRSSLASRDKPPLSRTNSKSKAVKKTQKLTKREQASKIAAHKRSVSLQSLASTASSITSSDKSHPSNRIHTQLSGADLRWVQGSRSAVSLDHSTTSTVWKTGRATIISKSRPYVSPYTQSVVRGKISRKPRTNAKTKGSMVPHPPPHPDTRNEGSITHALNRLTSRQNMRKYSSKRPPSFSSSNTPERSSNLSNRRTALHSARIQTWLNQVVPEAQVDSAIVPGALDCSAFSSDGAPTLQPNSNNSNSYDRTRSRPVCTTHPVQNIDTTTNTSQKRTPNSDFLVDGIQPPGYFHTGQRMDHNVSVPPGSSPRSRAGSSSGSKESSPSANLIQKIQTHNQAIAHFIKMQQLYHHPHSASSITDSNSFSHYKFVTPHTP